MPVITMTREMGAGGRDVGIGLAEALDLELVHYQVVEQHIAEQMNVDAGAVHRYLEGGDNPLARWRMHRQGVDHCTARELFDLAQEGNVLIRGWGATHLLRPIPHVVSVRVCAPMDRRIANLIDRVGELTEDQARKEIQANDAAHARVLKHFSDTDWRDALHYDLVLNTDRLPTGECVKQVMRIAQLDAFQETPASRRVLLSLRRDLESAQAAVEHNGNHHAVSLDEPVRREERDIL